MKQDSHLNSLKQKHDKIEELIRVANNNYQDDLKIKQLKKQRLLLKEKILTIETTIVE